MKLHYYKDRRGKWRWHLIAANGNLLAESGQGYARLDWCQHMANRICGHLLDAS